MRPSRWRHGEGREDRGDKCEERLALGRMLALVQG